jgi:hypothetical protein
VPVLGLLEILASHLFRFILPDPGLLAGSADSLESDPETRLLSHQGDVR